jgi:hypothetical protein
MKHFTFNDNDIKIIKKALRQRIEDLTRFADECRAKDQPVTESAFLEMANDVDEVLEKMEVYDYE